MDRPRVVVRSWPAVATHLAVGLGAGVTVLVALGSWLVLSDPVVAADVAAEGDLMPVFEAIVESLRSTLAKWLGYL